MAESNVNMTTAVANLTFSPLLLFPPKSCSVAIFISGDDEAWHAMGPTECKKKVVVRKKKISIIAAKVSSFG